MYLKWCYIVSIRSTTNFQQGTAGHSNDQKSILRPVFNSLDSKLCFIFSGETCKVDNWNINLYLKWCYIVSIRSTTNFQQGRAGHSNDQKSILRPVFNSLDSKLCFIFSGEILRSVFNILDSKLCFIFSGETCKVDNCIIILYGELCYLCSIWSTTNFQQGTAGDSNDQKSILRPVFNSLDSKLYFIFSGETC